MPRIGKGKVRLEVVIDKEVYEMLINVAPSLYGAGKYRGALSYVVEQALRAYLAPWRHTQTRANPAGKVRSVFWKVMDCIAEFNSGFIPDTAPAKQLTTCIGEVRGSDPRTIEKWLNTFIKQGLIKDMTPNNPPHRKIYEIVDRGKGLA